jgi:hypothetical protein
VSRLDAQLLTAEFEFAGAIIDQAFQFLASFPQMPCAQTVGGQQQEQEGQTA